MVEIIDTGIPEETNNRIIELIKSKGRWNFACDIRDESLNGIDRGLIMFSYDEIKEALLDKYNPMNCNALFVYDIIKSKLKQKFSHLHRICWNVYWRSISKPAFHEDAQTHKYFTFIYNLHDNDGGTEIIIGDKTEFYISKGGQAIVFPSHLSHRGVEPKTEKMRFSLAFMVVI